MKLHLVLCTALCATTAGFAGTRVDIGLSFRAPAPVVVHRAPPPLRVETVTVSPGPGYVWVPGHYTWAGRWIWMSGMWTLPPRPDAYWVAGAWSPQHGQWVEAHWAIRTPPPVAVVAPPPPPAPVTVVTPTTTEVIVTEPPPPPVQEVRVVAPGPGFVWVNGYWGWEYGHRVWVAGHWERPPHGHRHWVEPRWESRGGTYVFIRGYWR